MCIRDSFQPDLLGVGLYIRRVEPVSHQKGPEGHPLPVQIFQRVQNETHVLVPHHTPHEQEMCIRDRIYKDLSLIGRQGKFFIVYIVLMVAIFSGIGDGAASMSSFMAVVCFMLSINCFAYDEQNGFDKLVAASPLPPMQVVLSRYASSLLLGLLGCLLTAGVSSVVQLVKGNAAFNDMLFGLIVALVAALVRMAILVPIFYKFGVNKSRIIMLLVAVSYTHLDVYKRQPWPPPGSAAAP